MTPEREAELREAADRHKKTKGRAAWEGLNWWSRGLHETFAELDLAREGQALVSEKAMDLVGRTHKAERQLHDALRLLDALWPRNREGLMLEATLGFDGRCSLCHCAVAHGEKHAVDCPVLVGFDLLATP